MNKVAMHVEETKCNLCLEKEVSLDRQEEQKMGSYAPSSLRAKDLYKYLEFFCIMFSRSVVSNSCDPMDCSTPGFPILHHFPEPA